jgi:predicted membrane protein
MNKKGYIPPLAFALIVLFIIILIATLVPAVRETIMAFLNAIFGGK